MAKLADSGNLILAKLDKESNSWKAVWESFNYPSDTFLHGMKMVENLVLTSWASQDNPAEGQYRFQMVGNEYTIKKDKNIHLGESSFW